MRRRWRFFSLGAWAGVILGLLVAAVATLAMLVPGCSNGLGAFQAGVGNTPNSPPLAACRVLGQFGLPFSAVVADTNSSWSVNGVVPMNLIIVNNQTPVRVIATKQSGGNGILSLQLTLGFTVQNVSSTSDPYGTTSIQTNPFDPGFKPIPPKANPDVRLFVKGPLGERFSGLFEPTNGTDGNSNAFELSDRVPALVFFESPQQPVDAVLDQIQNQGPFNVDLIVDGSTVAHVTGAPTITIRQP